MPQADGTQRAIAVNVFPEDMRGRNEGHFPFNFLPRATMTNAAVTGTATVGADRHLTLRYPGGEKVIVVPRHADREFQARHARPAGGQRRCFAHRRNHRRPADRHAHQRLPQWLRAGVLKARNMTLTIRRGEARDAATITAFNIAMAFETEDKRLDPQRATDGCERMLGGTRRSASTWSPNKAVKSSPA